MASGRKGARTQTSGVTGRKFDRKTNGWFNRFQHPNVLVAPLLAATEMVTPPQGRLGQSRQDSMVPPAILTSLAGLPMLTLNSGHAGTVDCG